MKAGATILHAERKGRVIPLLYEVVQKAYLNRDHRLRLIIGTVRSRGARKKKVTNKRQSGGGGGGGRQ